MSIPDNFVIDVRRQRAVMFFRSKGRLPESDIELVEWLLEFETCNLEALHRLYCWMIEQAKAKVNESFFLPRRP